MKQHLVAVFHRLRCDRSTILPMLDKLTDAELQALYRAMEDLRQTAESDGARKAAQSGRFFR